MDIKKIIPAICLTLMVGCQADQKSITNTPRTNVPAVTGLKTFENCESLADFLMAKGGGERPTAPTPTDAAEGSVDADLAPVADVADPTVEEADLVKREGNRLYIMANDRLVIYDVSRPAAPEKMGEIQLNAGALELYVSQNIVAVIGVPLYLLIDIPGEVYKPMTSVTLIDVSNASTPKKIRELTLPGTYSDSRKVGGAVYLTLQESLAADQKNTLLSSLKEEGSCGEIYVPEDLDNGSNSSYSLWHLIGVSLTDTETVPTQTIVVGSWGSIVYATPSHLYLTSYSFESKKSGIYLFDLNPANAKASPRSHNFVPGTAVNQFSMDELDGIFRIASTVPVLNFIILEDPVINDGDVAIQPSPEPTQTTNYLTTFNVKNGSLDLLGQIDSIVPGESITAVRFLGDTAYVSTAILNFDPLVTVDLTNPNQPTILGELELPGVTNYVQSWGEDRLIAIGSEGGFFGGVILNLFDVSDLAHPKLIEQEKVPDAYYSEAQFEHLAFSYFEDKKIVAFPVVDGEGNSLRLYSVNRETGFTAIGTITHDDLITSASYSPQIRRSLDISNLLYSISDAGLKVTPFLNLSTDVFGELFPTPTSCCGGGVCYDCMDVPF